MRPLLKALLVLTIVFGFCRPLLAQDYSFEIPEEDKEEKLEWSGNLDGKYTLFHSRQSSPFYGLQFFNQDNPSEYLTQYRLELYFDADYQTKDIGFHLKTHSTYYDDSETNFELNEGYGNINLSLSSFVQFGKKAYNWGKGYAFNPVGYVNPTKDPENPELAQAGLLSMNFETIKSFNSDVLKTIAFTGIIIPPNEDINDRYAEIEGTDTAMKTYFLLGDIDIDIMGYYSELDTNQIGADFAANLRENIEIHGELSYFNDNPKNTIVENDVSTAFENGRSYLLGIRYLNRWDTTIILEYYHNDIGLTEKEYEDYVNYLLDSIDSGTETQALSDSQTYFKDKTLMQDYLYLKITQPEPFEWLYFTPSLSTIYNLNDNSLSLAVQMSYKPYTNFELILWPTFTIGKEGTEFGDKQNQEKTELWARIYF